MSEIEMLARDLAVALHGDEVEWRGFMSKAEAIVGRQQSRASAPAASQPALPDGMLIGDFKPCFMVNEAMNMVEVLFEDVPSTSKPLIDGVYHWIDQLVAHDDGRVVGLNFWIYKPPGKAPHSAASTVEPVLQEAIDACMMAATAEYTASKGMSLVKAWVSREHGDAIHAHGLALRRPGVHLFHCHQGEYEGCCKFGEDDCPAAPTTSPEPSTCKDSLQVQSSPESDAARKALRDLQEAMRMKADSTYLYSEGTLLDVYDFMAEDHKSGDSALWSIGYSELFDTVNEALDFLADKESAAAPDAVMATEGGS